MRKQTRHYSSVKEDEMLEFSELESDDEEPSRPASKPRRPQDKAQGYPRSECFRVEKNLLVYGSVSGFHQWAECVRYRGFKSTVESRPAERPAPGPSQRLEACRTRGC